MFPSLILSGISSFMLFLLLHVGYIRSVQKGQIWKAQRYEKRAIFRAPARSMHYCTFLLLCYYYETCNIYVAIPRFKVENSSSFSTSSLIHSWKVLRPTCRSKLSRWEMAKSKMEYFVGEQDLSEDISSLYVHAHWWLVSLRLRWRREFSAKREGEERSHRKPNTMVIRSESASGLPVPSAVKRRSRPLPRLLSASCQALKIYWTPISAIQPLLRHFFLSHPSTLSWLDRRQAFRYLNNPPIRLSLGVGMILRIYSPSTYEE